MAFIPDTPDGIIEELRRQAVREAADIGMFGLSLEEMLESEAADLLEAWKSALTQIRDGEGGDPKAIARHHLTPPMLKGLSDG